MPRISGRQLADHLMPLRPEMHVLYMSGYMDGPQLRDSVLETGAPFLQKPFTAASLAATVKEVIDTKSVSEEPKVALTT
jgi:FixJ family two-component response regulator